MNYLFTPVSFGPDTATVTFPNSTPSEVPGLSIVLTAIGDSAASNVRERIAQSGYELLQNSPNPFGSGSTSIGFTVPRTSDIDLDIFNIVGNVVRTLKLGKVERGIHQVEIDASGLTNGIYFYSLSTSGVQLTRQMTLIK